MDRIIDRIEKLPKGLQWISYIVLLLGNLTYLCIVGAINGALIGELAADSYEVLTGSIPLTEDPLTLMDIILILIG